MPNEVRIRVTANDDTGRTLKAVEQKFRNFGRMKSAEIKITAKDDTDRAFNAVERKFRALARKKAAEIKITAKDDTDRVINAVERKLRTLSSKAAKVKIAVEDDTDRGIRAAGNQLSRKLNRMRSAAVKVAVTPEISGASMKAMEAKARVLAKSVDVKIPVKPDVDRTFWARMKLIGARLKTQFSGVGLNSGAAFAAGFVKTITFGQVGAGWARSMAKLAPRMAKIGAGLGVALAGAVIIQLTNVLTAALPLAIGAAMLALPIVGLIKPMIDAQKEIEKITGKITTKQVSLIEAQERVREASNKKQRKAAEERVRDIKEEIGLLEKNRREFEKLAEPLVTLTDKFKHFVAEVSKPIKPYLLGAMELIGFRLDHWAPAVKKAFKELGPVLIPFTQGVLDGIEAFFKAIGKEMPSIKAGMGAWADAFPKIGEALGGLVADVIKDPKGTIQAVTDFVGTLQDLATTAGSIISTVQDVAKAYGELATKIDEVENNSNGGAGFEGIGQATVDSLDGLSTKIDDKIKEIRDKFWKWLREGGPAKALEETFSTKNMKGVVDAINEWAESVKAALEDTFSAENMKSVYDAYRDWVFGLGKDTTDAYEEGLNDEGDKKPDLLWDALKKTFKKAYDKIIEWAKGTGKDTTKSYEEGVKSEEPDHDLLWDAIKKIFDKAYDKITGWAKKTWKDVKKSFKESHKEIVADVERWKDKVVDKFESLKDKAVAKVESLKDKVVDKFESLKDKVVNKVESWKDKVVAKVESLKDKFVAKIESLKDKVVAKFEDLKDKAVAKLESLKDKAVAKAEAIKDKLVAKFEDLKDKAVAKFEDLKDKVVAKLESLKDKAYDKGKAVTNGLLDGLKQPWDKVKKWVSGIADWIKKHKGPLSLDRQLLVPAGKALMGGLLQGLKFGFGGVGDFVYKAGSKVSDIIGQIKNSMLGDWSGKVGKGVFSGKGNKLLGAIRRMFGIGGGTYPGHGERGASKAWDFMIHSKAMGNAIASFVKHFARQLGVMYVIWNKRIWSVQRNSEGWRPYTRYGSSGSPSQMHTNHVHVSLFDKGGMLRGLGINASGQPERVLSPGQTKSFDRLVRVLDRGGGGGAGNTYITVNAPNYVGSQEDLRRTLVDMNRRGQLEVIKKR